MTCSIEQLHAEVALQLLDLSAHRRLRNIQDGLGGSEAPSLCDVVKIQKPSGIDDFLGRLNGDIAARRHELASHLIDDLSPAILAARYLYIGTAEGATRRVVPLNSPYNLLLIYLIMPI